MSDRHTPPPTLSHPSGEITGDLHVTARRQADHHPCAGRTGPHPRLTRDAGHPRRDRGDEHPRNAPRRRHPRMKGPS